MLGGILQGSLAFLSLNSAKNYQDDNSPYIAWSESIAKLGIIIFLPLIFISNITIALLVFIVIAQHALNFQTHDYRRFYLGCMICFVIICGGAVETKSGAYLVYFLLYTASICILLGKAYMAQNTSHSPLLWHKLSQIKMVTAVGGIAFLIYIFIPRFPAGNIGAQPNSQHYYHNEQWQQEAKKSKDLPLSHQLESLAKGNDSQPQNAIQEAQTRTENQSQRKTESQQQGEGDFSYSGFDNSFDISKPDPNDSRASNHLLAYVRSDYPLYLRAQIFDVFDGQRWHKSDEANIKVDMPFKGKILKDNVQDSEKRRYEVEIESYLGDYIALAASPTKLSFPSSSIAMDSYGQLKSPSALLKGTSYSATSHFEFIEQRAFSQDLMLNVIDYRQLPSDLNVKIADLAKTLTAGSNSQLEKALVLEQHLRDNYEYSLTSVYQSQGITPLDDFLFNNKKGHCEYFASALSIMLRSIDIPSRLVTGFSASQQNPLTGYYEIYSLDAHAWVEAYVDDLGWVLLEPTAFYSGLMPKKTKLSAEKIDDYVKHVEAMQKSINKTSELSLENVLITIWLKLSFIATITLSYIKLYLIKFSPYIISVIALGFLAKLLWDKYKLIYFKQRLYRKVVNTKTKDPKAELSLYLFAIEELLLINNVCRSTGLSIEMWVSELYESNLVEDKEMLTSAFNQINYAKGNLNHEHEQYRRLFFTLYKTDLSLLINKKNLSN